LASNVFCSYPSKAKKILAVLNFSGIYIFFHTAP
jgi:hypothetical protein